MPQRGIQSSPYKPPICPACGYDYQVVPIAYGNPDPELIRRSQRGEVALGGCVSDDAPAWYCKGCRRKFDVTKAGQRDPRRPRPGYRGYGKTP